MSKDKKSSYYDAGGIETLDIIKAKLTAEQYLGYLLGNAIKYQCRMMHKTPENPLRDAEKAANYVGWLRDSLTPLFPSLTPKLFDIRASASAAAGKPAEISEATIAQSKRDIAEVGIRTVLQSISTALNAAERVGGVENIPEGAKCVLLSDTLAKRLSSEIGAAIAHLAVLSR